MARQLKVRLGLDNSEFRQGLKQSKQELSQFASAIRNAISFAGGQMLVDGLKQGFKETVVEGLNFNDTLQQANISFKTMLKSAEAANKQVSDLWQLAEDSPLEFPELLTAAKRMIAFKFEAEDVVDMLTDIGDAASALALGSQGVDRITLALGQMQMKGKVTGEEMRQLTEAGINAWEYLANALGKTVAETQKLSEKGLIPAKEAIDVILLGMRQDFGGGMQELAKTYSGMMATLKDSTKEAMGAVMKPAFDELTSNILPKAINKIKEFSAEVKEKGLKEGIISLFPEKDAKRVSQTIDGITASFKVLLEDGSKVISTIGEGARLIAQNWQTVSLVIGSVVSAWIAYKTAVTAAAAAQAVMNAASNANIYVLLASALIGVTTAAVGFAKVQDKMRRQTIDTAVARASEVEQTRNLVSEYYTLRSAANLTAEEKEKLVSLEQQLISKLPEATRLIDDQTLSYAQQKQVLEELIATKNRDALLAGALAAKSSLPDLKQQLSNLQETEKYLQKELENAQKDFFREFQMPLDQYKFFRKPTVKELQSALSDTISSRANIEEEIKKAEAAIKAYDDFVLSEQAESSLVTSQKAKELAESLKSQREQAESELAQFRKRSQDEAKAAAEEAAKSLKDAMSKMSAESSDHFKKLKDSIRDFVSELRNQRDEFANFGNMFERNVIEKFSPAKIQSRLNRFLKQIAEWQANLAQLAQKGVDRNILEGLRQMGLSGAGVVAGLNQMNFQQLSAAMESISQIRSIAAVQAMQTVTYKHELDISGKIDVRGYTTDGELEKIKTIVAADLAEQLRDVNIPLSGSVFRGVAP